MQKIFKLPKLHPDRSLVGLAIPAPLINTPYTSYFIVYTACSLMCIYVCPGGTWNTRKKNTIKDSQKNITIIFSRPIWPVFVKFCLIKLTLILRTFKNKIYFLPSLSLPTFVPRPFLPHLIPSLPFSLFSFLSFSFSFRSRSTYGLIP